ncbi:hypothetical protein [Streptomyces sp. C36]|uniref:hypothetical protein n=1 Tax=Streptomyces sp. C36 TaxID=3237122 RepID=UPI0034C69022
MGSAPAPPAESVAVAAAVVAAGGTARSGATGTGCPVSSADPGVQGSVCHGRSSPVTGRAVSVIAPESRLLGAVSRTPRGDGTSMNEGFCHVGRRLPNPASATSARPPATDRSMGGSVRQAVPDAVPPSTAPLAGGSPAVPTPLPVSVPLPPRLSVPSGV